MADSQQKLLLSLLAGKLHLSSEEQERAAGLLNGALEYLGRQRGASPSLLGQEQPSVEDVWGPCIVWLLKSMPGLLNGSQSEAAALDLPNTCLPLSELLDGCGISLVAFFKELPVVLNKLRPWLAEVTDNADAVDSVLQLREWQETLVSLTQLANKYKDLFWYIQRSNSSNAAKQPLLRAGWLTFLTIKAQLLPGFPDLVSCLELLVCVLNMLLASMPFTEQQLQELQQQSPAAIGPDGRFSTLRALSLEAKVDLANTKALMPQIEARFRAHLEDTQFSWLPQPLPAELPHPQADKLDTSCNLHLEGLASSQQQLSELVLSLDESYQAWYDKQGEINEREFLLTDFGALASPRTLPDASILMPASALGRNSHSALAVKPAAANGSSHSGAAAAAVSGGAGQDGPAAMRVEQDQQQDQQQPLSPLAALAAAASAQQQRQQQQQQQQHMQKPPLGPGSLNRREGLVLQGLQSPLPMMNLGPPGPATPISQAMGCVSWLRGLARGISLEPSPALQRFMQAAGADAGPVLMDRVRAAAEAVFMSDAAGDPMVAGGLQGLQHGLAQERQIEGMKLYWHVLEAMLRAEEARAGLPAAGVLLTRWPFHQCLLACSFEVVAASYRMGLLSFPAIPSKLGLKPFDLSKMIGPFVKAEPSLPRELKRHMFTVEEKILESLGWAAGSSFYKLIRAATGQHQRAVAAQQPQQHADDGDMHMQDAEQQQQQHDGALPSSEQQHELQQEAAAAAAVDAVEQQQESGTPSASAAADMRRRSFQGIKRGSETGSAGEPMDFEASRASGSPSLLSVSAKRQRGHDGRVTDSPRTCSPAVGVPEEEQSLPRALGQPPSSSSGVPAGADLPALAVLHDYCRKVLKLAAFRLVAVSEGLDFAPMTREDVVAHVHELLTAALYEHTSLFYSRHLDTLLLACLYGFCKVNKLQQITFREIIAHYKRQAHAKQEVFRTVVLQQTDPHLVTQQTGDIIAFYNAVFVPSMKGVLLAITHPSDAAAAAAAAPSSMLQQQQQLPGGAAAPNGLPAPDGANAGSRPSPMQTALQLSAAQQQPQQQRGSSRAAAATAGSPGSGGSAYRALSIPGPAAGSGGAGASGGAAGAAVAAGAGSTSLGGMSGLPAGSSSLLGGYSGSMGPLGASFADGSHTFAGTAGGGSFWAGADDSAAAGDGPAGAAAAAAAGGGSSAPPSRLSRLSRPGGGAPVGTAVAAADSGHLVSAHTALHPKAAASMQAHAAVAAAAGGAASRGSDAARQQDQGLGRARSGFRSNSEPQSPSVGATSGDARDSSVERSHLGSSVSPSGSTGGSSDEFPDLLDQPQQDLRLKSRHQRLQAGLSPSAAAANAAAGSPSAGLATLLQALDTSSKGVGPGAAGSHGAAAGGQECSSGLMPSASGGASGAHPASSCGQQQTATMMDL